MSESPSTTPTDRPQPDLSTLVHTFLKPTSPYLHRLSNPSLLQRVIQQLAVLRPISTLPNPSVERSIRDWAFRTLPARPVGQSHGTGPTLSLLVEVIANIKKAVEEGMKILRGDKWEWGDQSPRIELWRKRWRWRRRYLMD
ncbi:hypothetical protein IFR04_010250 [Cadophora malorum]|uniref:Uncharacterized protein n=1 Tax=Cadophora malorum TaxID=108018 RepID=A0A8H7W602_9HELO|nr:hypothetical protein IFR04_010250 [Cadophora malorum]